MEGEDEVLDPGEGTAADRSERKKADQKGLAKVLLLIVGSQGRPRAYAVADGSERRADGGGRPAGSERMCRR